jgi:membrane protein
MSLRPRRRRYALAVVERAWRTGKRLLRAEAIVYAGYLAFLTMLGLVPALAVAYWLAEQSALASVADRSLREYLTFHLFPDSAQEVIRTVAKLRVNARKLGITALAALFVDVVFKAYALHCALGRIFERPHAWWQPVRVLVVVLLILPLTVAATVWGVQFIENLIVIVLPTLRKTIDWLFIPLHVSLPMWTGLIALYYGCVPDVGRLRNIALVSAVVMLAIEGLRLFLTGYFSNLAQVRSLYGTFTAIPVMMLSLFSTWLLVLSGAAWLCEGAGASQLRRSRPRATESE